MATTLHQRSETDEFSFSVVQGGPFYALRKKLGLVPDTGLRIAPRILGLILITWVPVIVAALIEGVAFTGPDPLLRHFGIHSRLLIAVPLLLLAEFPMERNVRMVIRHFVDSGLIQLEQRPDLAAILRSCERLRDSFAGHVLVLGVMAAAAVLAVSGAETLHNHELNHELIWTTTGSAQTAHTTFAGRWFMYVSRPVYLALLALWAWRLIVVWSLMRRISKLDLQLVPGHPDRAGGLGFLELIVRACNPLMIANSVVLAGRWAHDVRYHAYDVQDLKPLVAVYLGAVLLLFLGPFLMFSKKLLHFKHRSTLQYAVLTGAEGRLIDDKWVKKKEVGDNPLLGPPEIGPMADAITLYQTVSKIRPFPLGKEALVGLAVATILPIIPVFALQIPLKDLLLKLGAGLL